MATEKKDQDDNPKNRDDCCLLSKKRDHAWGYFSLHADQRISVFKMYLAIFALFITSSGFMVSRFPSATIAEEIIEIGMAMVFIFLTIIFYLLDKRNRCLIKMAEESLRDIESKQREKEEIDCKNQCKESCCHYCDKCIKLHCVKRDEIPSEYLFIREDKNAKNTFFRHTACFHIIFCVAVFITMILIFYSLISISYYERNNYSGSYLMIHTYDKVTCKNLYLNDDGWVPINK